VLCRVVLCACAAHDMMRAAAAVVGAAGGLLLYARPGGATVRNHVAACHRVRETCYARGQKGKKAGPVQLNFARNFVSVPVPRAGPVAERRCADRFRCSLTY